MTIQLGRKNSGKIVINAENIPTMQSVAVHQLYSRLNIETAPAGPGNFRKNPNKYEDIHTINDVAVQCSK